ncbi:MAG: GNAT family N-acetyltransferase [Candidatus Omnitrophica bacterium]|jgi:ribosomal protein S18 acetylase RimI-like enzyme|nr:GNAT family N-acetyltransferase [Candidatus Omnitrophota bacterium]
MIIQVNNNKIYWEFIRSLRNDTRLSDSFVDHTYISQESQEKYMSKYGSSYYIYLLNNIPVGFIGVVNNDLRIAVHPDYYNKGIGTELLYSIIREYPFLDIKVRKTNISGQQFFDKHKLTYTLVD